jgi:hypothetical protein
MGRTLCKICQQRYATTSNGRCDPCKAVETYLETYLQHEEGRRFVRRKLRNAEDERVNFGTTRC